VHDGTLDGFRLSPQQAHIWTLRQSGDGPVCRARGVIAIDGPLDPGLLNSAWRRLVADHEILRTAFRRLPGMLLPLQVVSDAEAAALRYVNLDQGEKDELASAVDRLLDEIVTAAPALDTPPLVQPTLVRLSSQAHLLLVDAPALCLDGPSIRLLAERLGEAYAAGSGEHQPDARDPVQYADVAEWALERLTATNQQQETGRATWQTMLAGTGPARLPWERRVPDTRFESARLDVALSADLVRSVERAAAACGAAPAEFLLTCWQTMLLRLTGQTGLVCGVLHEGRLHQELRECLGPLARMLPDPAEFQGDRPFASALQATHHAREAADRWHDVYPLADGPRFSFCYEYQTRPSWSVGGLRLTVQQCDVQADRYGLKLVCARRDTDVALELHYDAALTTAADAHRVVDCYEAVVGHAAQAIDTPLGELRILPPAERQRILLRAAGETLPADPDPVHRIIEKRVRAHPNRTAIRCGDQSLTYRQLDERAARLARELRELGAGPDVTVAICLPRSCWGAVAVLGVLKAGGAWLPLDPSLPAERLTFLLRDAGAGILITQHPLDLEPALQGPRCVLLDAVDHGRAEPASDAGWHSHGSDLAYLMYTSGSTGQPKGVMITHGSLSHYVQALRERLQLTADDVYLHTATFAFSSSVRQLLVPLAAGASIVLATAEEMREPIRLFETIRDSGVTIIDLVPSYLGLCLTALEGLAEAERVRLTDNDLRLLLTASEPLPTSAPERWWRVLPHPVPLLNMFGQTETTGIVTTAPVRADEEQPTGIVPVGRPIPNTRVYVLDGNGQPVPEGVVGELHIGGAGLGRGYLRRPGLTAERFVPDPYGGEAGARLYRTGDLGLMRADGEIEFVGRIDNQIKVRGFRVEPGEIESVLRQHPGVDTAAVVARDHGLGDVRLTAFVVASRDRPEPSVLQAFARDRLPHYMVPSTFIFLAALPLTPTGKLNRRDLEQRELSPERPSSERTAPATPTEQAVAAIWKEVLGVDEVGAEDDFFELGGNSLLLTRAVARIRRSVQIDVPLGVLFECSTISKLASVIDRTQAPAPGAG
jgi:amino acid adenylation domain-containing protein